MTRKEWAGWPRYAVKKQWRDLWCHDDWNIGIVNRPISAFLQSRFRPAIQWLPAVRKDTFRADPFGIITNDRLYVFFEEFKRREQKGVISFIEVLDNGCRISTPRVAIELRSHMSYPYLCRHDGEVYCIPETHTIGAIQLYRASNFPYGWELVGTLIEGFEAGDATVFKYGQFWWLTCVSRCNGSFSNLNVFCASNLLGPWSPHRQNPVKRHDACCRPAGTPFVVNGELYRPAQDCSGSYGRRIIIYRIVALTPDRYVEESVSSIEPDTAGPYPDGIHTVSQIGNLTLVDGRRTLFSRIQCRQAIARKVRRITCWLQEKR